MYILGPCIAVPVALALLLIIVCLCQRKKNAGNQQKTANQHPGNEAVPMELNSLLTKPAPGCMAREFPMAAIRFTQDLGEGNFGKVYSGELVGYYGDNSVTPVVIKSLRESPPAKLAQDFRREAEILTDIKHPNIVCLLGVCFKQQPMSMLFEFLSRGDLHEYLLTHSPHSDVSVSDDEGTQQILSHVSMLDIACQIAAGMEHLAIHQYTHRDLAARNILIGNNLTVKISDFGLAKTVYASDYYRLQNQAVLPVRWMPVEAILYGKFSSESDVWSFGVVLWEIYSYGLQPYYGYSNQEVVEMIRVHQILPCPDDCPARLYGLMVECWHEVAARRPVFKEINQRLQQWRGESNKLSAAHSHSGHSSSTHNSQGSHHSNSNPSNNTATTALSTSNQAASPLAPNNNMTVSAPSHPQYAQAVPPSYGVPPHSNVPHQHVPHPAVAGRPNYPHPALPHNLPHTGLPPPGMPTHHHHHPPHNHHGNHNGGLYKKPSPPESISSQQSSSVRSTPPSSVSNYKPPVFLPNGNHRHIHSPTGSNPGNPGYGNPHTVSHNNKDQYIPDARTANI